MIQQKQALLISALILFGAGGIFSCADSGKIKKQTGVHHRGSKAQKRTVLKKSRPYTIMGITYYPLADSYGYSEKGDASWYGPKFHGKKTANGEVYNMHKMTAAHKTLPLGTMVAVKSFDSGKEIVVRINDRGPFVQGRIIDLSKEGAKRIGMIAKGTANVQVTALAEGRAAPGSSGPVAVHAPPDFNRGEFYVQVGAFKSWNNAKRLKGKLTPEYGSVRLVEYEADYDWIYTRVQVGPFRAMAKAVEMLKMLKSDRYPSSFIVAK